MKNFIIFKNKKYFPSKVVCIGRNYVEHIKELKNETPEEMVFFIKPNSSISNKVVFPKNQSSCHFESEFSFLIINNEIKALAFGLDLTLREVQWKLKQKGLPWERAKAFDSSAYFTEFVEIDGLSDLSLEFYINGELKQKADISMMINKPQEILNEAKTFTTFENYDILMTGTPKGVDNFKIGDEFTFKIQKKQKNIIVKELIVE